MQIHVNRGNNSQDCDTRLAYVPNSQFFQVRAEAAYGQLMEWRRPDCLLASCARLDVEGSATPRWRPRPQLSPSQQRVGRRPLSSFLNVSTSQGDRKRHHATSSRAGFSPNIGRTQMRTAGAEITQGQSQGLSADSDTEDDDSRYRSDRTTPTYLKQVH